MSAETVATILTVLLVLNLGMDLVRSWLDRRTSRIFAEALDLLVPALEDLRRIEPHLDESVDLAIVRLAELRPKMHRMANGYITPIGLLPRRKRRQK